MPELTREEKLKLIDKLPQKLQDFLYSEDTGAFLLYLGGKYKLSDDKISLLSKLVGDIILGITPVTSLAQEINAKITTDPQTAMNLAQELYTELLAPVMTETKPVALIPTPVPKPIMPIIPPATIPPQPVAPITKPQLPITNYQLPHTDQYREPINTGPEIVDLRNQHKAGPLASLEPWRSGPLAETPPAASEVKPPVMSPSTSLRTGQVEPPPVQMPISAAPTYIPEGISAGKPIPARQRPARPPASSLAGEVGRESQAMAGGPPSPIRSFSEGGQLPRPMTPLTFTKPIERIPLIEAEPHRMSPIIAAPDGGEPRPAIAGREADPHLPAKISAEKPQFIIRPPGLAPTDLPHDVLDLRRDKGEF